MVEAVAGYLKWKSWLKNSYVPNNKLVFVLNLFQRFEIDKCLFWTLFKKGVLCVLHV